MDIKINFYSTIEQTIPKLMGTICEPYIDLYEEIFTNLIDEINKINDDFVEIDIDPKTQYNKTNYKEHYLYVYYQHLTTLIDRDIISYIMVVDPIVFNDDTVWIIFETYIKLKMSNDIIELMALYYIVLYMDDYDSVVNIEYFEEEFKKRYRINNNYEFNGITLISVESDHVKCVLDNFTIERNKMPSYVKLFFDCLVHCGSTRKIKSARK